MFYQLGFAEMFGLFLCMLPSQFDVNVLKTDAIVSHRIKTVKTCYSPHPVRAGISGLQRVLLSYEMHLMQLGVKALLYKYIT